jgi:hypothetical protein
MFIPVLRSTYRLAGSLIFYFFAESAGLQPKSGKYFTVYASFVCIPGVLVINYRYREAVATCEEIYLKENEPDEFFLVSLTHHFSCNSVFKGRK